MVLKRKAKEAFSDSHNARPVQKLSTVVQLSAFAAARARYEQSQDTTSPTTSSDVSITSGTNHAVNDLSTDHTLPHGVLARNLQPDGLSHADRGSESDSGSDETTSDLSTSSRAPLVRLSSIRLPQKFESSPIGHTCDLRLEQSQFVTAIGEFDLLVCSGSVNIYGSVLHPKSGLQRVHALTTHALPRISAMANNTVVRLSSVVSLSHSLAQCSPLFRNISVGRDEESSFRLLETSSEDAQQRLLVPLDTPKNYQTTLTQLAMKSESHPGHVAVACIGGKSTGKSTFARHLCNKLITRTSAAKCLYLDLDPGQPEFGPPGQVYLVEVTAPVFGPPFTHFASKDSKTCRLIAAHTIAATSFKDNPQHYINCVKALLDDKRHVSARKAGKCPLVINTCGWVGGLGARVLCDILNMGVTDAVFVDAVDDMVVRTAKDKCENLHRIEKPPARSSPRTPAELRQMQTMAHFHVRAPRGVNESEPSFRIIDRPISQWRPWIVNYDRRAGSIAAIVSYGQYLDPRFLAEVLDGSLVALTTVDQDWISGDQTPSAILRTAEDLPYLKPGHGPDPRNSECVGLALIRAIDTKARQLHIITPLSDQDVAALVQKTIVLIRGAFDSPDWAYLEDLHCKTSSAAETERPWVARRGMLGVEGSVWRLRHPPTAARAAAASSRH